MIWAAPDGPATTLRYEAFCEGIQYAEAMIAVSEAVDTKAGVLGPQRTDALQQVLLDMVHQEDEMLPADGAAAAQSRGLAEPGPAAVRSGG